MPGKGGTGMTGTADCGGMGAGNACGAAIAPNKGVCGSDGAEAGRGGGAPGTAATGGGGPPENIGGGGGGGTPPKLGEECELPPDSECAAVGVLAGSGNPTCGEAAIGVEMGVAAAPSFGSGGGGNPSRVFCRIGGGAALLVGGAGGKLGGGGGGGAAPNAEEAGPSPAEEDFFERRSSKTSRSDPPLSLMMQSFS